MVGHINFSNFCDKILSSLQSVFSVLDSFLILAFWPACWSFDRPVKMRIANPCRGRPSTRSLGATDIFKMYGSATVFYTFFPIWKKILWKSRGCAGENVRKSSSADEKDEEEEEEKEGLWRKGRGFGSHKILPWCGVGGEGEKNLRLLAFENPSHTEKFANRSIDM